MPMPPTMSETPATQASRLRNAAVGSAKNMTPKREKTTSHPPAGNGCVCASAAVNVSASAGDGGGLVANVNRWRKQLGLAEETGDAINKSTAALDLAGGGKATVVELLGTDPRTGQPAKLVGVLVPQAGQTWFYKLMGEEKVVETQKDAFTKFVQTVKY